MRAMSIPGPIRETSQSTIKHLRRRRVYIAALAAVACVRVFAAPGVDYKVQAVRNCMAYASQLDSYHKDEVYEALVQALADGGDFDQALLVAKAAGDQGNGLYYAVAWSASKQGKLDDVLLQSLRKVEGEYALVRAADLLSEAGNFAGAVRLLDQVKPTSSLYKIDLANAWLNADQIERAAAVFEGKDGKDSG